jgi:hypothetical protein
MLRPMRLRLLLLVVLAAGLPLALGTNRAPAARPAPPPTTIDFSGYRWTVKDSGKVKLGPGPNLFAASNVSVDAEGRLHLRITSSKGRWSTAEVINTQSLGRGTYTWVLDTPVDALDRNVVLGLFTWNDAPDYNHRELDVEFARWGNAADPTNGQFVVQPYDGNGNLQRLTLAAGTVPSTHSFTWAADHVDFSSPSSTPASWRYEGPDVPQPGGENARMNLWLFRGAAPSDGRAVVVVIRSFTFPPA